MEFICLAVILAALCLPTWFTWCWFEFGLFSTFSTSSAYGEDDEEDLRYKKSYESYYDYLCDEKHQFVMNRSCEDFCDSFENIQAGGRIMMIFMILTTITLMGNIAMLVYEIRRKKTGSNIT